MIAGVFTLQFGHVHAELVALFQHPFPPVLYKLVESHCEARHALAEVLEAKVHAGKTVG